MAKNKPNIGKQGTSKSIQIPSVPSELKQSKGRGNIEIGRYKTDKWTIKTYVLVVLLLTIPFVGLLIALYTAGLKFLATILLGVAILCALLVSLAYWVDKINL
jgi:hypothetical protein